jgi:hypothetical protein
MYLWLAVKLLRLACKPKWAWFLFNGYIVLPLIELYQTRIRQYMTFDTLFKIVIVIAGVITLKHALGHKFIVSSLHVISDVRPMANIWWDIYCPLQWLFRLIW